MLRAHDKSQGFPTDLEPLLPSQPGAPSQQMLTQQQAQQLGQMSQQQQAALLQQSMAAPSAFQPVARGAAPPTGISGD